jgi:hypothetical protein
MRMEVYLFSWVRGSFRSLTTRHEADLNVFLDLVGQPVADSWREVPVELIAESDHEANLPIGDFPFLSANVPVFSRAAVSCLGSLLSPAVEVLPLSCPPGLGDYYAINVISVIDGLDERRSRIEYFSSTGRVKRIKKHEFDPDRIEGQVIFRIPQTARSEIFVNKQFVEAVSDHDLQGSSQTLVWRSG